MSVPPVHSPMASSETETDPNEPVIFYGVPTVVNNVIYERSPDEMKEEHEGYIILIRPPQKWARYYMVRVFDQSKKLLLDESECKVRMYPVYNEAVDDIPMGRARECVWHGSPYNMYQVIYCKGDPKEKMICEFGGRLTHTYKSGH